MTPDESVKRLRRLIENWGQHILTSSSITTVANSPGSRTSNFRLRADCVAKVSGMRRVQQSNPKGLPREPILRGQLNP